MKSALLIHGWNTEAEYYDENRPTASNDHWFPWLTKQLLLSGTHAVSIEMPKGYYPEYSLWKRELERYDIDENTTLIGHSCGGGFLVRWLSENDVHVGKVLLVSPWLGLNAPDDVFDKSFFNFKIDSRIADKTKGLTVFYSLDDKVDITQSAELIRDNIKNVKFMEFIDKGHFTLASMHSESFPELLQEINT